MLFSSNHKSERVAPTPFKFNLTKYLSLSRNKPEFEICLEILTQVKLGNCHEDSLMRCTNLSQYEFEEIVSPLLSTNILKQMRGSEATGAEYQITSQGEQFIDLLTLGLNYVELGDSVEKPKVRHS